MGNDGYGCTRAGTHRSQGGGGATKNIACRFFEEDGTEKAIEEDLDSEASPAPAPAAPPAPTPRLAAGRGSKRSRST